MAQLKLRLIQICLRSSMAIYSCLLNLAKLSRNLPVRSFKDIPYDILLTGTFYSDNWLITHLRPLAGSNYCKRVRMVAAVPVPNMEKVEAIYPCGWLISIMGKTPARIFTFIWIALRDRPHIVGGFHMLPNGLVAVLIAQLIRAKSLYFCGGGPREILGGGYMGNPVFAKLKKPDHVIERRLFDALSSIDLTITMGIGAIDFFKQYANSKYHVVPGGFEEDRFYPAKNPPDNDLILIGRLTDVKRVDVFLQAIKLTRNNIPDVSALVVGDGTLLPSLKQMAEQLGLKENVKFVGHQDNVEDWLRRSKIFVLTSDSEGVSQAMIQAMLCGLPPIVSDVGDLSDLVNSGQNGYLVGSRTPEAFAKGFTTLLKNQERLTEFAAMAYQSAEKYRMENVSRTWDQILQNLQDVGGIIDSTF
ncbi:MAG: glycosyltransferase [Candidatus Hodarchaeota archaeon]